MSKILNFKWDLLIFTIGLAFLAYLGHKHLTSMWSTSYNHVTSKTSQHLLVLLFGTFRIIAANSKAQGTNMTSQALGVRWPWWHLCNQIDDDCYGDHTIIEGVLAPLALTITIMMILTMTFPSSVAPSFFHTCVTSGKTARMEDVERFKVKTPHFYFTTLCFLCWSCSWDLFSEQRILTQFHLRFALILLLLLPPQSDSVCDVKDRVHVSQDQSRAPRQPCPFVNFERVNRYQHTYS